MFKVVSNIGVKVAFISLVEGGVNVENIWDDGRLIEEVTKVVSYVEDVFASRVVKTSVVEADSSVVNNVGFKDVDCITEVVIIVIVESAGSLVVDKEAI